LGIWFAENEGAKFWLSVLTEIQNRSVEYILIASVDGLKGFPEAIESVFPKTEVQLCIVHMVRHSLKFVPYEDRKKMSKALGVSMSGFYTWKKSPVSEREAKKIEL
jgi:putative transposase